MNTVDKLHELIRMCDSYVHFCMNADEKCPLYDGTCDCIMRLGMAEPEEIDNAYILVSQKKIQGVEKPTPQELMRNYMVAWCIYHHKKDGPCMCPFAVGDGGCIMDVFHAPDPVIETAVKICTNYLECGGK